MTVIKPENLNFQSPLNFEFQIQRAPYVNFHVQKVNLPGMLIQHVFQHNPFVQINHSGEHIDFEALRVTFKIDEDWRNYFEIYNWLTGLGFPENYEQYANLASGKTELGLGIKSDLSLKIMNSKHNFTLETVFDDAFPVEIQGIDFDTTLDDVPFISTTVVFKYNFLRFNKGPF